MPATTTDDVRALYTARRKPTLVDVPEMAFIMLDGHGSPDAPGFAGTIGALYAVAYTAHFAVKHAGGPVPRVMPLEGLWANALDADRTGWDWTLMIMQPPVVTTEVFERARDEAATKRESQLIREVRFERFAEGRCAQVMHVGPYSAEAPTIEALHAFIAAQGCTPRGDHHEIYLGDPRRAAPERLRTILRQPVA